MAANQADSFDHEPLDQEPLDHADHASQAGAAVAAGARSPRQVGLDSDMRDAEGDRNRRRHSSSDREQI
jgi:hypothetical protein